MKAVTKEVKFGNKLDCEYVEIEGIFYIRVENIKKTSSFVRDQIKLYTKYYSVKE